GTIPILCLGGQKPANRHELRRRYPPPPTSHCPLQAASGRLLFPTSPWPPPTS
uniref:Uncharacterized protein n=1 Tax=Aegilops tauschii subsp. strangulata TaxID=200361 RepID=A0A452YWU7_AEGTS